MRAYEQLKAFYSCLHDAVTAYNERGMSDDLPSWFDDSCGICDNWTNYIVAVGISQKDWSAGLEILRRAFLRTPGITNPVTPFNDNIDHYQTEAYAHAIWYNAARVEWLANRAAE